MTERGWLDMYLPRAEYAEYIKKIRRAPRPR